MLLLKLPLSTGPGSSRQGVSVGLELIAQRPALAKQHLHPGHLSPRLLRLLVLSRSQREELPRLFCAPNQNEGLGPRCVIQRPLDEGSPRLDELLLASCPNQLFTRAVGMACHLHFRCLLLPLTQLERLQHTLGLGECKWARAVSTLEHQVSTLRNFRERR